MSLRLRLAALTSALAIVLLGGLALYLHAAWEQWTQDILLDTLGARAAALAGAIEVEHDGELEFEGEDEAFAQDPAHPFRVERPDGRVLYASPFPWPPLAPADATGARVERFVDARGQQAVVLSRPVADGRFVLRVVGSEEPFLALERRFFAGLWVALAVALLLGALLAAALARVFVRPIEQLSSVAARIGARSLDERVSEENLAPELRTLAQALNGLLARLEAAFRRERDFVARASHALRTPAATLLAQAEVALRRERSAPEYRQALEEIAGEARLAARLTDELLALSRLDEGPARMQALVPLSPVAVDMRTLFAPLAEQRGLGLQLDVPEELSVAADPVALREALANLLENALRYTPAPGTVGLRARRAGRGIEVAVWDTGPGIPDAEKAAVVERFQRGSAGAKHPGSGLGLAIVRAIAQAHGAALRLEDRAGGGLEAVLAFPG